MSISPEKNLKSFAPISLAEMDGIKLMNRIDKKYLTDRERLTEIASLTEK